MRWNLLPSDPEFAVQRRDGFSQAEGEDRALVRFHFLPQLARDEAVQFLLDSGRDLEAFFTAELELLIVQQLQQATDQRTRNLRDLNQFVQTGLRVPGRGFARRHQLRSSLKWHAFPIE